MSYLHLPRIQFGGLFFANPSTINNFDNSFNPSVPLTDSQGAYVSVPMGGPPAGWNAVGVAQIWLSECKVLSAVGPSGTWVDDPVVGAAVESPSPTTPKTDGTGGYYDIAKLVDLDPDQQGRSAVYGLRIYVTLPDGGGFSGLATIPELQFLETRAVFPTPPPIRRSSWGAVGTWMGQITEVDWAVNASSSPFLAQFQEACQQGIAFKLTVDLHQNNPTTRFTPGNIFCYGRVLGSLGPILPGELAQVWPGRQIAVPPPPSAALESVAPGAEAEPAAPIRTIDDFVEQSASEVESALESVAAATPPPAWYTAPALVSQAEGGPMLHIDLGGSLRLQASVANGAWISDGKFLNDSGISVGVLTSGGTIQDLAHGQVSFASQYQLLASQNKQVNLLTSAGLVDIPLEPAEASLVASSPLAIKVDGATILQEPASGLFLGSQPFSLRLEPGTSSTVQIMARKLGAPIVGQKPVTWQVFPFTDGGTSSASPSDLSISWDGPTDAHGIATLTISTIGGSLTLPSTRIPMDSLVYYVYFLDSTGQLIGDGYGSAPNPNTTSGSVSVLRFQPYTAPADPSWADAGPVLQAYARLYPGMKDRLDIGDPATVKGFAKSILARMVLPFLDPAYMPVTRDLSPAKVDMLVAYLETQIAPPSA